VIGRNEGFSKINDTIFDYITQYFRDKILNFTEQTLNVSSKIILYIQTIINLTAYDIIKIILQKYGFGYLLKFVFYLSFII
jgi:hypothetical protein